MPMIRDSKVVLAVCVVVLCFAFFALGLFVGSPAPGGPGRSATLDMAETQRALITRSFDAAWKLTWQENKQPEPDHVDERAVCWHAAAFDVVLRGDYYSVWRCLSGGLTPSWEWHHEGAMPGVPQGQPTYQPGQETP
jgi:hypothetical protein